MKNLKYIFLFFVSLVCVKKNFAQQNGVDYISIDSITERQVLDKAWKFHAGDDAHWAQKNFNDSAWLKLTKQKYPTMVQMPDDFKGIGWVRLHLRVDSSLANKNIVLGMLPIGAAEVYLDGRLIGTFGKPAGDKKNETINVSTELKGQLIQFTNEKEHVIAVRFSNWRDVNQQNEMMKELGIIGFTCFIGDWETYSESNIKSTKWISTIIGFFGGFFIALSLLHFLLYLFYRKNRSNLYYSIFSFCLFGFCFVIWTTMMGYEWTGKFSGITSAFLSPVLLIALLGFLHTQFYEKVPKTFHIAFALSILYIIFHFVFEGIGGYISAILFLFVIVESLRVVIVALRKKKEGSKIIGAGVLIAILFPIISIVVLVVLYSGKLNMSTDTSTSAGIAMLILNVMMWSSIVSISLSMSIYLARQFASTNKGLEKQIIQIKELSEKMIEQEKEKKKILESQNEQLEIQVAERTAEVVKQKEEIEEKSEKLAEAYKDVRDSIQYAKRIQESILPDAETIKKALPDSFVLYEPKDIVSGDFYWLSKNGNKDFIAAADCTGHGVPGAFMSTIGCENLNAAVAKSDDVGVILNLTNNGMKKMLHQGGGEDSTRDGMDIALISLEFEGSGKSKLEYSGANRPLWIIRNNSAVLEEIKATKVAIGGLTSNEQQFAKHSVELNKGDTFYLTSDGYADQFSPNEKKLMTKRFKEILISIQNKTMDEQKNHLHHFMKEWRGNVEQVDDILVIGVRI